MAGQDPILLYDGVCGLCDRTVQFVLRHDPSGHFRFSALQSALSQTTLSRHGRPLHALSTMYVVLEPGTPSERLLERSAAVRCVLSTLGGRWRVFATLLSLVPVRWLDRAYDRLATNRYAWFGRFDSCPVPRPEWRARFLDG